MKENIVFFVMLLIVAFLIPMLPKIMASLFLQDFPALNIMMQILGKLLGIVVYLGLLKVGLVLCDGNKPKLTELFSCFHHLIRYIPAIIFCVLTFYGILFLFMGPWMIVSRYTGENAMVAAATVLSALAFMAFVIFWIVKLSLFPYYIIDKRYGPLRALQASVKATAGSIWQLLLLKIVLILINFLGGITVIGLFVSLPIYMIADAYVYRKLMTSCTAEVC